MNLTFCFKKSSSALRFRIVKDISCRAFFADPAVVHDYQSRTDLSYDVNVVRDKKERRMVFTVDVCHEL